MGGTPENAKDGKKKKVMKRQKDPKGYKLTSKPGKIDTTLEIGEIFVTTVSQVADLSGVPGLGVAAELVLAILTRVQDMRDNNDEFKQLVHEAKDLVTSVTDAFTMALDGASPEQRQAIKKRMQELKGDVGNLTDVLTKIHAFALKKQRRSWLWRFIYANYDIQTIRQFRDAMRHSHEVFSRRTDIVLRVDLAHVHSTTDQILEAVKRIEEQNARRPYSQTISNPPRRISQSGSVASSNSSHSAAYVPPPPPPHPYRPQPHPRQNNPFIRKTLESRAFITTQIVDNSVIDNSRVIIGDTVTTNNYDMRGGMHSSPPASPASRRYSRNNDWMQQPAFDPRHYGDYGQSDYGYGPQHYNPGHSSHNHFGPDNGRY